MKGKRGFARGRLNARCKELAAAARVSDARARRRAAKKRALLAVGVLSTLVCAHNMAPTTSPLERERAARLYSEGRTQAEVGALLGRSQSSVSRALGTPRQKGSKRRGRPRLFPPDSEGLRALRALISEDPFATCYQISNRLREEHGVHATERTVNRERARWAAEDRSFKKRKTNRYAYYTEQLLDMHIGF